MSNGVNVLTRIPELTWITEAMERIRDIIKDTRIAPSASNSWGWGANGLGQLDAPFLGSHLFGRMLVYPVPSGVTITKVAAGQWHTLFLASDGSVWACGLNLQGQVGLDPAQSGPRVTIATRVEGISGEVTDIAAGYYHSLVRTSDGSLWAWGSNTYGELGIETNQQSSFRPVRIQTEAGTPLTGVSHIAGGASFTLACMDDSSVLAWGNNMAGQLGVDIGDHSCHPVNVKAPLGVLGYLTGIKDVAAGAGHSLALTEEGCVFSWGSNSDGQLGRPFNVSACCYPDYVQPPEGSSDVLLRDIKAIAAGFEHSLALSTDGRVFAWGNNSAGQVGHPPNGQIKVTVPQQVRNTTWYPGVTVTFTSIAAGYQHNLAIGSTSGGRQSVWGWGDNSYGQLGTVAFGEPFLVLPSSDTLQEFLAANFTDVAAGWDFSLAVESGSWQTLSGQN